MTNHMNAATEALQIVNTKYAPKIVNQLDKEDRCGTYTVTINRAELELLQALAYGLIYQHRSAWEEELHDKTTDVDPIEKAYYLYKEDLGWQRAAKLRRRLQEAKEI